MPSAIRTRRGCAMYAAMDLQDVTEAQIRDARHAYYGDISYVDDHVGALLVGAA